MSDLCKGFLVENHVQSLAFESTTAHAHIRYTEYVSFVHDAAARHGLERTIGTSRGQRHPNSRALREVLLKPEIARPPPSVSSLRWASCVVLTVDNSKLRFGSVSALFMA